MVRYGHQACRNHKILYALLIYIPVDPSSSPNVPSSPVSSELSELSPKAKRRRSLSSLSEADEDEDDEEDQPLATRITQLTASRIENGATRTVTSGQRSGKSGVKSRAQTGLSVKTSPTATEANGMINGIIKHESRRRSEDGMDSGQLDRLATGVTVDAGGAPSSSVSACIMHVFINAILTVECESPLLKPKNQPPSNCKRASSKLHLSKMMANHGLLSS